MNTMDKTKSKRLAFTVIFSIFVVLVFALSRYFRSFIDGSAYEGPVMDISAVNWLDRVLAHPFSKGMHDFGTAMVIFNLAVLLPAFAIYTATKSEKKFLTFLVLFLIFIEAFVLAKGTYDTLKTSLCRTRPFMYFENPYMKSVLNGDWQYSWPSGHTANAFLAAAFITATVLIRKDKTTVSKIFIILSYTVAVTVGVCRILSGNHFFTDVISGALVGTMIGFIVPAFNNWFGFFFSKKETVQ